MLKNILKMQLSAKIPALIVGAAVILAVGLDFASTTISMSNAKSANSQKLKALLQDRANTLSFYLESIEQDMHSIAASPFTLSAIADFKASWGMLGEGQSEFLQSAYIDENPNPTGQKEKLDRAAGDEDYHTSHEKYHPWFRTFLQQRGYYDIFLFDLDGNLIYTVFKELDYATNLVNGEWQESDLGKAFRAARDSQQKGQLHFFDFHPYAPSHGAPAGFISTAVYEGGAKVGVLAFQMPVEQINAVMSDRTGLGETGETFIVGQDHLMRSDSPLSDTPTLLKTRIENDAVNTALAGSYATMETTGYRSMALEMHAVPLEFLGAKWALVAAVGKDEISAPVDALRNQILLVSLVILLIIAAIAIFMARRITRPLTTIVEAMTSLAEGHTETEIDLPDRHDEIGGMVRAVRVFRDNAIERQRLEHEQRKHAEHEEEQRKAVMRELADSFSQSVGGIVSTVTEASTQLQATAQAMQEISDQTNAQASSVSSASEEASLNVQTVAASTEEMSNSISEISRRVAEAAIASKSAAEEVATTRSQMTALAGVADKIGGVVSMITDIAEQTNLLALNATIESARAGVAGKGFAVVASEVKELATQTAQATGQISEQINEMQTATNRAVASMEHISGVITEVEESSSAIAAAMEQQGAATQEIATNVQEAADGTRSVSESVAGVTQASQEAGQASGQVTSAATELFEQSERLQSEVSGFIAKLRQGDADRRRGRDPNYKGPDRRRNRASDVA